LGTFAYTLRYSSIVSWALEFGSVDTRGHQILLYETLYCICRPGRDRSLHSG